MSFPQLFFVVSAYKDPVENQHMKKILDKVVTGFFVIVLGILWYCSTKYEIRPNRYSIIIYDVFGKQATIDGIRTDFKNYRVARSFISEYQKMFPHYDFSMTAVVSEIESNSSPRIIKKLKDSVFSCEH